MLSPNFIGTVYATNLFMWHPSTNSFSSEISMVPAVLREMFSDDLDLGFAMQSAKTNQIAYFSLENGEKNDDGDYVVWRFKPTESSVSRNPRLKDVVVLIYNT